MDNKLIFILFIIGIFTPSSIGGAISSTPAVILSFVGLGILVTILFRQKTVDSVNLLIGLAFGVAITAFTLFSKYDTYKYGNGLLFIILFCLSLINNKNNPNNLQGYLNTLMLANILLAILSFGLILEIPAITDFTNQFYAAFYPELIPNMIFQHKPVTVFATHSVAGFYDFIFLWLNLMAFRFTKQKRYLLSVLFFMIFLFFLQSSTSLTLLLLAALVLQFELYKVNKHFAYFIYILELFCLILLYPAADGLIDSVFVRMFSDNNGLGGRYAEGGNLIHNLNYIMNNPLSGIGFGYSTDFMYADSGYLEYSLRNSILGALAIIFVFCRYILRNIKGPHAYFLIFIYLFFEIGFSNLIYFRMLSITLFTVAFFNQLQRHEITLEKTKSVKTELAHT